MQNKIQHMEHFLFVELNLSLSSLADLFGNWPLVLLSVRLLVDEQRLFTQSSVHQTSFYFLATAIFQSVFNENISHLSVFIRHLYDEKLFLVQLFGTSRIFGKTS